MENHTINLAPGRYRMRVKGKQTYCLLDVTGQDRASGQAGVSVPPGETSNTHTAEAAAPAEDQSQSQVAAAYRWQAGDRESNFSILSGADLEIYNDDTDHNTFIIEKNEDDTDALRPVDLFVLQQFRDLFSEESVAADTQLDIGVQTILFTDIVGSTRFYTEEGDAGAYAKVRMHFAQAYEHVIDNQGTIVKTIGDAIMAAFPNPAAAMQAALGLQNFFTETNSAARFRLRISLHSGPCLAVNLNSRIDFFGNTVNYAAKLQAAAGPGDIVFSDELFQLPEVRTILKREGRPVKRLLFHQHWAGRKVHAYRLNLDTPVATQATAGR